MGLSNLSECESESAETPQACEAAIIPNVASLVVGNYF